MPIKLSEVVHYRHTDHDSGLPIVQLQDAGLITLSEGIVILHFEIHFKRAGGYRLDNGLDDLTIAGGISRGCQRYVITASMVGLRDVAIDIQLLRVRIRGGRG